MLRLIKWLLIVFVLVPFALLAAAWAILEFTPQEKLRALAARELGRKINRQVEIGPLHLGLNGLGIDELKLSEVPNFHAGILFAAKGVHLGWGLRTLWEGLDIHKKFLTRSSGHFQIAKFYNPHYTANNFSIHWSLSDMDPTWSHLSGSAKLDQGTGLLLNIDQLMAKTPSARIALTPVLAVMNLEKLGVLKLGLPDLRRWPIQGIHGNYAFKNGRMTIERFTIDSAQLAMATTGVVELGSGNLLLDVQLHSPPSTGRGAFDATLRVSGTINNPKVDLSSLKKKAFKATIGNLLKNPQGAQKTVDDTIKKLFH